MANEYYFTNLSLLQRIEISFTYLHIYKGNYLQKFDIYKSLLNIARVRIKLTGELRWAVSKYMFLLSFCTL